MNRIHLPVKSTPQADMRPDAMICLTDVVKTFKNAAGAFDVLKGINVEFRPHEFVSVIGRSGSGKSTLLNMMTGIDHPTSGTVQIGSAYLHTLSEGQMSVWRGRNMGIVFQFFQLLPMLTLLENVILPMDFCNVVPAAEREARALALLKEVELEGFEHKYPAAVSGGQQQSAAVARALANDPPILVADEPTGNLDTRTAELILSIFEAQVASGKTVIMVTHDSTLAARAARQVVLSDGELVNEAISSALPEVAHSVLLSISKRAKPITLVAGEELPAAAVGALAVVTDGQVDVCMEARPKPLWLARLMPGCLFAPRWMETPPQENRGLMRIAIPREPPHTFLRALEQPVSLLALAEADLQSLLAASPVGAQPLEDAIRASLANMPCTETSEGEG